MSEKRMIDMTREEEIRARAEAATKGPWYNGDGSVDRFFAGKNTVATPERVIVERATYNDEFDRQTYADIGFIAHAREDIPYLLDENARLRACLESWQRLAAYEDTGLTPAEVEAMKAELDSAKRNTTTVHREPIFDHGEQTQWSAYKCAKCGAWQPDHFPYCPGCGRMIVAKEDAK